VTERPLSIAVDANVLDGGWGGIPKYLARIARELACAGDHVHLLANTRAWDSGIAEVPAIGLRLKGQRPWRDLAWPVWAARKRADVLWAPNTMLPVRPLRPTVVTVHDLAPLLFPDSKPPAVVKAFRTVYPRSVRAATRVICVSAATARDAERLWDVDPARIEVIPNGVDARFSPGDRDAARAAVARHFGVDNPYVLHVGTLEPRKGLDVLFDAADGAPWSLVLAGRLGFDGERLAARARAVGATLLQGVSDDALVDLYRGAEALAAPAIYEGFGITPLEAMACGTPAVVADDAGALTEVSGDAAVVIGERTPEAWLTGIAQAAAARAELVPRGLALAARYDWADVARRTHAVLAAAVDGAA
jgi:glycosyltransferase involved in cell wall biosynthesis